MNTQVAKRWIFPVIAVLSVFGLAYLPGCGGNDAETTAAPIDRDKDGFPGAESGGTDCDDSDDSVNPGATDVPSDGIDQDCSGADAEPADMDGDEFGSQQDGGSDCDDNDSLVHPGANDSPGDGTDQDCDGEDG